MITEAKLALFIALFSIAIVDYVRYKIPNSIVIPGIALGVYLTGNWHWALIMLCLGIAFFGFTFECPNCGHVEEHRHKFSLWRGGDVKMLVMLGAFMALNSLYVFASSLLLLSVFRVVRKYRNYPLPYAPFVFTASLPFLFL